MNSNVGPREGIKGPEEVLAESFEAAQQSSKKQNSGHNKKKDPEKKRDHPYEHPLLHMHRYLPFYHLPFNKTQVHKT